MRPGGEAGGDEASKWAFLGAYRFVLAALVAYVHTGWMVRPYKPLYVPLASVLCFLLISGYSIAASLEREPDHFYRRRFARIYPTYLFALLLTLGLAFYGRARSIDFITDQNDPLAMLGSFLMLQGMLTPVWGLIGPSWSLSLESFYYVIAPWLNRLRGRALAGLWLVSAGFYMYHAWATGDNYNHSENGLSLLGLGWAWISGFLFYRFRKSRPAFWILTFGAPAVYSTFVWEDGRHGWVLVFLTGQILASDATPNLGVAWRKAFNWLGDMSYPLYICHFQLLIWIGALQTPAGGDIVKPQIGIFVVASLLVSALVLKFVDRPLRSWILRRGSGAVA